MEHPSSLPGWSLTCLLLLSLPGWPGAGAQDLEVLQSKGPISLLAGETLTLNCTVTAVFPAGPMKWFKGKTSGRQLIYAPTESQQFPRVTWVNIANTDFSIRISDVRPEDAGIYYCVKFRKASGSSDTEFKSGPGTTVLVIARPSPPAVTGPPSRAEPGASVNFTCTSEGFSPRDITVHWLRNRNRLGPADTTVLPAQESTSYSMSSTVWMTLAPGDVQSQLTCRIEHSTLPRPLEETVGLSHFLRVPPKLRLETTPLPIRLNAIVKITCRADEFYPNDTSLTWLENGNETELGKPVSLLTQKPDGRYSLTSSLEFNVTEQKNLSTFTCRGVHDSQPPVNSSVTLKISNLSESDEDSNSSQDPASGTDIIIYIAVAVVCAVLTVLAIALLYLIRARQNKGKGSPSVRLQEPEKTTRGVSQDSDPNNLAYAELNFDKASKKSSRPVVVEENQQSEYASIQTGQLAATDDNLTYADLDMVHLSKAPKRPAPRPEEVTSEYASVEVQRK